MRLIVDEMPKYSRDCLFSCNEKGSQLCKLADANSRCNVTSCKKLITAEQFNRDKNNRNHEYSYE